MRVDVAQTRLREVRSVENLMTSYALKKERASNVEEDLRVLSLTKAKSITKTGGPEGGAGGGIQQYMIW